ncbi:hypothetical protein ACHAQA_003501 [Verticillium albo-atrum]
MLFVDFSDEPATETPQSLHDIFTPETAQWYDTSSYGKLSLNITVDASRFYRMPKTAEAYQFGRGLSYQSHVGYILDAFNAWKKETNTPVPNGIDPLTDVLYIITTANAKSISTSATLQGEVHTQEDGFIARRAVTLGPDEPDIWLKVLQHETGHTMDLPDMYPLTSESPAKWAGNWDLMATLTGDNQDFFAWNKWRLGWISDEQVECVSAAGTTVHRLTPLESATGVKAVVIKESATEVLVAEVRSKDGVDACAKGVLLYTVSTELGTGEGPFRVVDGNPNDRSTGKNCGWDELDNALLSLDGGGAKSASLSDWGVTVTVLKQTGGEYEIRVVKQ